MTHWVIETSVNIAISCFCFKLFIENLPLSEYLEVASFTMKECLYRFIKHVAPKSRQPKLEAAGTENYAEKATF